jgi:hypothetical protein
MRPIDVSGLWSAALTYTRLDGATVHGSMNLAQSGTAFTGTLDDEFGGTGSITGTLSGRTINFVIALEDICSGERSRIDAQGQLSADGRMMTGTFTASVCGRRFTEGTFNAVKR